MKKVRLFLLLIISCMLFATSGLIAGVFAASLQRTFVRPPNHPQRATMSAGAMPTSTMPTLMVLTPHVLAQDTFQRPDQALWGVASDGQHWEEDANAQGEVQSVFIDGGQGIITRAKGTVSAILGPVSSNVEVLASASVSRFGNTNTINFVVVVRWTDAQNWYKALIDGTLVPLKRVRGVTTRPGGQPFTAQANTRYTVRLPVIGAVIFARVWPSATQEPPGWMVQVIDTSLTAGRGGVRVLVQHETVVHLVAFAESLASSQV